MKKTFYIAAVAVFAALSLSACKEETSFATTEEARGTARENSLWNAQKYRQTSPKFQGWDIQARGDSTQEPKCPQGDGWATMDFISPNKAQTVKVKCNTVSSNVGCLEADDFKSKSYAAEEGVCQPLSKVPHPLPKIAK